MEEPLEFWYRRFAAVVRPEVRGANSPNNFGGQSLISKIPTFYGLHPGMSRLLSAISLFDKNMLTVLV